MSEPAIDFAPFSQQPTAAQQERLRAAVLRGDHGREAQQVASGPSLALVPAVMVGGLLVLVGVVTTLVEVIQGGGDVAIGLIFIAVGAAIGVAVWLLAAGSNRRAWRTTVVLAEFARVNDLEFQPDGRPRQLPGIPRRGSHASVTDRVSWTAHGLPAEMASYHRASGGSQANSVSCRYLAVRIDVDLPPMTFRCGRRGPTRGEERHGPDAFEGSPHSLRPGGNHLDERATVLFDDEVVELLTDRKHPCNAEYVNGWFLAYYRPRGDKAEASLWRHAFALADAVAATRRPLQAPTR